MFDAFLPTAIKFHYQWNLRELSAVTQGLCLATPDYYNQPLVLVRLWLHEVRRAHGDRLNYYLTTLPPYHLATLLPCYLTTLLHTTCCLGAPRLRRPAGQRDGQ